LALSDEQHQLIDLADRVIVLRDGQVIDG